MVLPIFPMIWVNHRKKHQWYSHIIWKLLVLSTSRLACNSFMACILHMYPYGWASMRKPWHVLNNVCNKQAASTGGLLKVFLFNIPGNCRNRWYTIPPRLSQNSQANSAEVLAGITTLKIWARPQYRHFSLSGVALAEWVVSNISNGFYVLPQVDTITITARHVPSQMKHSKSPVRDLKKVENWFYPLAI